jgi:hypothetical protein
VAGQFAFIASVISNEGFCCCVQIWEEREEEEEEEDYCNLEYILLFLLLLVFLIVAFANSIYYKCILHPIVSISKRYFWFISTKDLHKGVAYFTQRYITLYSIYDMRHQIFIRFLSGIFQCT